MREVWRLRLHWHGSDGGGGDGRGNVGGGGAGGGDGGAGCSTILSREVAEVAAERSGGRVSTPSPSCSAPTGSGARAPLVAAVSLRTPRARLSPPPLPLSSSSNRQQKEWRRRLELASARGSKHTIVSAWRGQMLARRSHHVVGLGAEVAMFGRVIRAVSRLRPVRTVPPCPHHHAGCSHDAGGRTLCAINGHACGSCGPPSRPQSSSYSASVPGDLYGGASSEASEDVREVGTRGGGARA